MISDYCLSESAKKIADEVEKKVNLELGQDNPSRRLAAIQCALLCELLATAEINSGFMVQHERD